MKRVNAKVQENRRDDPKNELDKDPNTWLIEAQLEEDLPDWERAQLHFQAPGVSITVYAFFAGSAAKKWLLSEQ